MVARFAGISYAALIKIAHNRTCESRLETLGLLDHGLKEFERLRREVERERQEHLDRAEFERLKRKVLLWEARLPKVDAGDGVEGVGGREETAA